MKIAYLKTNHIQNPLEFSWIVEDTMTRTKERHRW
jgi:hypothetical protein